MTNTAIGFFCSLSAHLLLFVFLTVDFSLSDNKFENFSYIPVKFISLPEENIKKIKSLKISKLKKNKEIIQSKALIEKNIINKLPIELDLLAKKILDQDLMSIKISNETKEVQITIGLIQQRINSVWKKPSLINQDIKVEINRARKNLHAYEEKEDDDRPTRRDARLDPADQRESKCANV